MEKMGLFIRRTWVRIRTRRQGRLRSMSRTLRGTRPSEDACFYLSRADETYCDQAYIGHWPNSSHNSLCRSNYHLSAETRQLPRKMRRFARVEINKSSPLISHLPGVFPQDQGRNGARA